MKKQVNCIVLIFIFKLLLFKQFICRFLQFRSEFTQHILTDYFVSSESGGKVLYHEKKCAISVMSIVTIKK